MKVRKKWLGALLVVALSLSLIAVGCSSDEAGTGDRDGAADQPGDRDAESFDTEVTVKPLDLLKFEPGEVRVKLGERVRLVLDNEAGTALHDFSVEKIAAEGVGVEGDPHVHGEAANYDLHVAADAGNEGVMFFTPQEAGEYEFFCSVPGHREAGMEGTLIVEA